MQEASSGTSGWISAITGGAARDDRVLPVTRTISAIVVPFVAIAFVVLYLLPYPDSVTRHFAWIVRPQMSAMLMGAGYMAGAYFFSKATFAQKWHHVAIGFPGIATFAALAGLATILHWDKFNHGLPAFYVWVALYAITPFLVAGLWLLNRRTDPRFPDERDAVIPFPARALAGLMGAVGLLFCLTFLFFPAFMIAIWPWPLSPATSQVAAAWFSLFAVVAVLFPLETRWSAMRIMLQSLAVALVLFFIATVRAWDEFNKANPLAWGFAVGVPLTLIALVGFYAFMERRFK